MYDRIFAGTLLLLSGLVAWAAAQFEVPFQYEPLGPKAFPFILSGLLAITAVWLLFRPSANDWQPTKNVLLRLIAALVLMYAYAAMYEPLGFIVATTIVGGLFSWKFGAKPMTAAIYALAMSVLSYFLLTDLLQLNVPAGTVFGG